jgi:serine-type D-Ala-D-Ala carboxypeptidase/endopeptidase
MELPDTPAGRAAAWLLDRDAVSEEEITERYAPSFLRQIPPDRVQGFMEQVSTLGEHEVESVEGTEEAVQALVTFGAVTLQLQVRVESDEPHRITGLRLAPPQPSLVEVLDQARSSDAPIGDVVSEHVGKVAGELPSGGVVVAVVAGGEEEVVVLGDVPADGIFEIGSITKPFTGILLAEMVSRGEVGLEDPVERHLPDGVAGPAGIRLIDLATHSAGLPRLPPGFEPTDMDDPYADFTVEDLYTALGKTELEFEIGSRSEYSNYGFGLLGHVLGLVAGDGYERALRERVLDPLGIEEAFVVVPEALTGRRVDGHAPSGHTVPHWNPGAILGAGGIESSITGMLRFLRACLEPSATPIAGALTDALTHRMAAGEREQVGLGWHHLETSDGTLVPWHNGGTGGFRSFTAFRPEAETGIVALCNARTESLDPAALAILAALGNR